MSCVCAGKGIVVVNYHDGSPFDLGVCRCHEGQRIRAKSPASLDLRAAFHGIAPERVQLIENLTDDPDELAAWGIPAGSEAPPDNFMLAGRVGPKAHL